MEFIMHYGKIALWNRMPEHSVRIYDNQNQHKTNINTSRKY